MGVWIGAILSYARILAPRVSRIFILGQAAAGLAVLLDELFGMLFRARQGGASMPVGGVSAESQVAAAPQEGPMGETSERVRAA